MKHSFVSKLYSLLSIVALVITSTAAMAQAAQAEPDDDVEEVLITGSLIKGTPENAPNPITAITEEDIRLSGSPSIVNIMKNLPLSSGVDGSTNQFQSNGLEGSANVNLRGLGPGRTLTLVNGQRRSYSGVTVTQAAYQPFVNLNLVPMAAVSRIEILRDGASATYGSDAISGVVNFITRAGFEGFEVGYGINMIPDASEDDTNLNLVFGKRLGDSSNILVTYSQYNRGELKSIDREGVVFRPYADNPNGGYSGLGQPGNFILVGGVTNSITTLYDPDCEAVGGFLDVNGAGGNLNRCRFHYVAYDNVVEEENGQQLYLEFNTELSNWWNH